LNVRDQRSCEENQGNVKASPSLNKNVGEKSSAPEKTALASLKSGTAIIDRLEISGKFEKIRRGINLSFVTSLKP